MRTLYKFGLASLVVLTPTFLVACGDDDDNPGTSGGAGGTGGAGGSTGGTGGSTGGTGGGTGGTGGGTGGTGGGTGGTGGGTGGTGGSAGDGGVACDLSGTGKAHQAIPNPTGTMTLTANTIWDLSDTTYVADGQTLTIEPCTRIEGQKVPLGTLIVSRGGKLVANGTASAPILFTSPLAAGSRGPGNWGGVVLLGKAPNFQGDQVNIEGLAADPKNQHGGTDPADNSGSLKYVGIQFPGFELSTGNEINGLTLGSVGTGTVIENIFVGGSADDCFEWFGGTVNSTNLIAQNCDDDMFDTDYGYAGKIMNAFGRQTVAPTESSNGIESGYDDKVAITPTASTNATHENVTVCGFGAAVASVGYASLTRKYVSGTITNFVGTGFNFGVNQEFPPTGGTPIDLNHSILFGMFADAANQIVNPADDQTKDGNFDEIAWFNTAGKENATTPPAFTAADCKVADAPPAAAVKTSGVGAFKANAALIDWIPADWWKNN
jgi:hypothetical protein